MTDQVETFFKAGFARPGRNREQRARRREWEREWKRAREARLSHARGWCELPGCDRPAVVVHHRAGRRVPGANRLELLMALCSACHTSVHAHPEQSYLNGWLVKPSTVEGDR